MDSTNKRYSLTTVKDTEPFDWHGLNIHDMTAQRSSVSSFAHIEVKPLETHPLSYSKKCEKYYYMLSGQLHFHCDGTDFVLSEHGFLIIPPDIQFAYTNRSNKPVELLLVHTPRFSMEHEVVGGEYYDRLNIYHVIDEATLAASQIGGVYAPPSLGHEGFIHFCDYSLIARVAGHYYENESELIVLEVNPALVEQELKYEDLQNEGVYYPHLFGALNTDAIVRKIKVHRKNGIFDCTEI